MNIPMVAVLFVPVEYTMKIVSAIYILSCLLLFTTGWFCPYPSELLHRHQGNHMTLRSCDCPSTSEVTMTDMGKLFPWISIIWYNHNEIKHNKTMFVYWVHSSHGRKCDCEFNTYIYLWQNGYLWYMSFLFKVSTSACFLDTVSQVYCCSLVI